MAEENKDIDPMSVIRDEGMDSLNYVPFQSANTPNTASNMPDIVKPADSDYRQVLQDIYETPTTDLIPSFMKPGSSTGLENADKILGDNQGGTNFFTQPLTYGNKADIEKYIHQADFKPEGFNPLDPTNYDTWVAKETWSSALSKGLDSFSDKFGTTYSDYWKDYGRMVNALVHADTVKLLPDEQQMLEQNYAEHISAMRNFVFIPEEDEDAIFSKRSVSEFLGNAGFAMGTMAGVATELVADALITLATAGGGIGTFGATVGRLAGKLALKKGTKEAAEATAKAGAKSAAKESMKQGNFFTGLLLADEPLDVITATDKLKRVNHLNKTRSFRKEFKNGVSEIFGFNARAVAQSEGFLNKAWSLSKGLPLAGTALRYGEKAIAAAKAGRGLGEVAGIGFKGLRRLGQEYNLAATEASFEAVSTYGATLEQMINNHVLETGQEVDPVTFERMRKMAGEAAFSNYGTNLAILLATNQIQFGTLFNKMGISNKAILEAVEGGSDVLRVSAKRKAKSGMVEGLYDTSGFLGFYGVVGKIAKDFGKRQALYEVGRHYTKGLLKFQVVEGIQENLQEMSNAAWKDYYVGRVNGVYKTLDKAFEDGAAEQFTAQGFRTFLQGALTGMFIGGPTHVMTHTSGKIAEYGMGRAYDAQGLTNPIENAKKQRKENIDTFNAFSAFVGNNNIDKAVQFTEQANEAMKATEAAAEGKDYEFVNARDNAMIKAAFAANNLDMIDAYKSVLSKMGQDMTADEFQESFGVKLEDTKYNSVAEFVDSVQTRITNYSDTLERVRKFTKKNLAKETDYEVGTEEFYRARIIRNAQEHAIELVALNELKAQRADERAKGIVEEYSSIEQLANSSDYVYRVLASGKNLTSEISNIEADIKVIEEGLTAEGLTNDERKELLKQKEEKEEELQLLDKWSSYWSTRDQIIGEAETEGGEKKAQTTTVLDAFVGLESKDKITVKQDDGTEKEETVYQPIAEEVQKTFRKLLNLKNKQQGIDVDIELKHISENFQKVVDFIQLDQDARDYLEAAESLMSPDSYAETVLRMQDGMYKFYVLEFANSLESKIGTRAFFILLQERALGSTVSPEELDEIVDAILTDIMESTPYQNIMKIISSKDIGLKDDKYFREQLTALDKVIEQKMKLHLEKFVPEYRFEEVISDEDYEQFKEDKTKTKDEVIESIINRIVTSVSGTDGLSPRETEIYEAFKSRIDTEVTARNHRKTNEEEAKKKGLAYFQFDDTTSKASVYDKEGNLLQDGMGLEEAEQLVEELNKSAVEDESIQAQLDYIDNEFQAAIGRIEEDTVDGATRAEDYKVFSTVFYDLDNNPINLQANFNREALIKQLEQLRDQFIESVKKNTVVNTQSSEGPAGDTSQPGTIPGDINEEEGDLEIPTSVGSEIAAIYEQIKVLKQYQAEGRTETPTGEPIQPLIDRLLDRAKEIENEEQGNQEGDVLENVTRRTQNAKDQITELEEGGISTIYRFSTIYQMQDGFRIELKSLTREVLELTIDFIGEFEINYSIKGKLGSDINEGDVSKIVETIDEEGSIIQGEIVKTPIEGVAMGAAPYSIETFDGSMFNIAPEAKIYLASDNVPGDTQDAAEDTGNISSDTISDDAPVPVEGSKDENEGKFAVYDTDGKTVIKFVDSQEEADRITTELQQLEENRKWASDFLKTVAVKTNKKGRFKNETKEQFFSALMEVLEQYNKTHKKKQFTSIEDMYNSGKTNRAKIDKAIGKFIKGHEGIEPKVKISSIDKKTTTNKKTQESSDTNTDTNSQSFDKAVLDLYNELKDLQMPTTTDKTGQIGIIFPEGTTDFTKFVDTTAEQRAISLLLDIKPSCEK